MVDFFKDAPSVKIYVKPDIVQFEREIQARQEPAILKGLIDDWPILEIAKQGPKLFCDFLKSQATSEPMKTYLGPHEMGGRFSYSEDAIGRNFDYCQMNFSSFADRLMAEHSAPNPAFLYAGSLDLNRYFPQLLSDISVPLISSEYAPRAAMWIGNRTIIPAHWDEPDNMACVIAGRRRFTLLPIDQIGNLYFGPFENTLAGQQTSMVDFDNPDFERFPRFRNAQHHAMAADLEAGDILYMPNLWIHHVRSLESFGLMINFWWGAPDSDVNDLPYYALIHAMLALKDRSYREKQKWQSLFEHYVFQSENPLAHVPIPARGVFAGFTPQTRAYARQMIMRILKSKE